jgi:CBS domain-containing protein
MVLEGIEQAEFAPAEAPEPVALLRGASRAVESQLVRDIMVIDPVTVAADTPIADIARVLTERHLHRVLVTEGTHVRGVITALDVVRLVADGKLVTS